MFHGKPFVDNQVSNVYALWNDVEPKDLELQKSELESVEWIGFQECMEKVRTNAFPNCIRLDELEILDKKIYE